MTEITLEALWIQIIQLISPRLVLIGIAILMLATALIVRSLTQRHVIRYHLGDVIKPQIDLRDAKIERLEKEAEVLKAENARLIAAHRIALASLFLSEKKIKPKLKAVEK